MNRTIRPSSLTTANDCMRRFAANTLGDLLSAAGFALGIGRALHIGAAIGSGVHAAASYSLSEKREHGDENIGAESEAIDRAEAEFTERSEYGLSWDQTTSDLSTAKKQLARMTRSYRQHIAPTLAPLLVEQRLTADIGDGWEVSGQADTLAGDPDNIIEDLKTGVRQRANGIQYATYAMLFRAHGYRVTGMAEDFVPRVRLAAEQPPPTRTRIEIGPAINEAWETLEEIKRTTAVFEARAADPNGRPPENAFRANPASQLCSPNFCRAWGTEFCRAHRQ